MIKSVVNGWQVTGITQFSGQPEDVNAGINNIDVNQRLGGSWTEASRGYFTSDPSWGKERDKYQLGGHPIAQRGGGVGRQGPIRVTS